MLRLVWLAGAIAAGGVAWALDPPRPAAPPPAVPAPEAQPAPAVPATEPAPDPQPDPAGSETEEEETLPPLPPGARSTGPTPQRFDPSEEVRADFPVSFPADI